MSYSEYKTKRKELLRQLRKLGLSHPAKHYPLLPIDSDEWEMQLSNMEVSEAEKTLKYYLKAYRDNL